MLAKLNRRFPQLFAALLFGAALLMATVTYSPGLGGSLHFDDPHNLGGLEQVVDVPSGILFATQGEAGPLGRPLALASFAPQAYAWPHAPDVFLYTNIQIHLLNGALVVWMLYLLGISREAPRGDAAWNATISGALWMVLPILASSSLLIVQRMATLSTTFLLLGFVGYLYSRSMMASRPRSALLLMSICLVMGTSLAALAKENGALLPLLVLITELTVLRGPLPAAAQKYWRTWFAVFLLLPAIALFCYLALQLRHNEAVLLSRDFSVLDRLLTEAHILWKYLLNAFLPRTSSLGPFHDDQRIFVDWLAPSSLVVLGAWLTTIALAVRFRRRAPWFAFAVGWYLVAHALESSTIPLELYFEHRNYVPLIGPVFALVCSLSSIPAWRNRVRAALLAYACLLATVLTGVTSLWGNPLLAAEMWAIYKPDSRRATQYLAQQLVLSGDNQTARRVLRDYLEENPQATVVALQILARSCLLEPEEPHTELIDSINRALPRTEFEIGIFETISGLYRMAEAEVCQAVNRKTIYTFAELAAGNPSFQRQSTAHHNLHVLMSEETFAQRNLALTMQHIETALASRHSMTTVILALQMLESAGLQPLAKEFLVEARLHEPRHPMRAAVWRRQIMLLEAAIDASMRHNVATPQK